MSDLPEDLLEALDNAIGIAKADQSEAVDIKALREREGLSQEQFAQTYGFNLTSLKRWEEGARQPSGPARSLLQVIDQEPAAVKRALAAGDE